MIENRRIVCRNDNLNLWHVELQPYDDVMIVMITTHLYLGSIKVNCVRSPNWLERILGITHEQNIDKAVRSFKVLCDQMNAEDDRNKLLVEQCRKKYEVEGI